MLNRSAYVAYFFRDNIPFIGNFYKIMIKIKQVMEVNQDYFLLLYKEILNPNYQGYSSSFRSIDTCLKFSY
jgi:hypothetical protein